MSINCVDQSKISDRPLMEGDGMVRSSLENEEDTVKKRKSVIDKKARRRKVEMIYNALSEDPVDLDSLRQQAISEGGLLSDTLRRKVWPKLLNLDPYEVSPKPGVAEIQSYKEYTQVLLDVQRCLRRFPPGIPAERRLALQDQLTHLIVRVLLKHPELCYYQGYHDICVTFLLVAGEELGFALMDKLSMTSLSVFMEPTMESTVSILNCMNPIIGKLNPELRSHLEKADVSPVFCLSWLITWFGHVLNDYSDIVRLYDFFLASHSLMPIYLAATVVLHRQNQILELEPDMAIVHHHLSHVPDNLPFEKLVKEAMYVFADYPPERVMKDAKKMLATEKGFYHSWITPSQRRHSLKLMAAKQLKNVWLYLFPNDGRRRHRAVMYLIALLPAVIAIYLYSHSFPGLRRYWVEWRHS